jgi:hypothetical protein
MTDIKNCSRCKKDLPLDTFELLKSGSLRSVCRPCRRANARQLRSLSYKPYLATLLSSNKTSSKRRGFAEYELTLDQLVSLWESQNGRCAVSGVVLTHHNDGTGVKDFNASIDRIDSTLGYIPGNIQLVALRVNIIKQALSTDMLYWWVKTIYQHSCD